MIDISGFKGEIPRIADKLLPVDHAASAINCDLESGNIQPVKGVSSIMDIGAAITTIFKMNSSFLQWDETVNIVKSLVADSGNRIVLTGAGYPKETNAALALVSSPFPTTTRRLGIPAPTIAPTVTLIGEATDELVHSSSYVYTMVAKWEDGSEVESAPSPPTAVFDVYSGITPRLTEMAMSYAEGIYATHYRFYRLNAGNNGSEYQYVDEIARSEITYDDTKTDDDLGEVLSTTDWTAPVEALSGLIATSHGLVFGFNGNTIYPSEVFIPYAFPAIYSLTTESDIVGFGYTGSLVAVLTETVPYLLIGQDPLTLSMKRLGYQQKCVSARSIVNIPGGVVYASPDGLYAIDETGTGRLITENIFTREQWKALSPENLFGFYYNESYVGFFSGTTIGFSLHLGTGEYKTLSMPQNVYGGHYSPDADLLYLIQTKSAVREIVSFRTGNISDYTWLSKIFEFSSRQVYTAGKVAGDFTAGSVTLSFYVDGILAATKAVSNDRIFRVKLAGGKSFQIKAVGKATIDRIMIGRSAMEIVRA
ncbi:hypothetical protein [Desulfobacula sp.]|uniref:hypothetical protein n=1 Tax=Desulfobacula sp. TaxID=2593537 RepID=UPI0026166B37|nr:hypothetical protein [Desulfobacula sp.]